MPADWTSKLQALLDELAQAVENDAPVAEIEALRSRIQALKLLRDHALEQAPWYRRYHYLLLALISLIVASALWLFPYPSTPFSASLQSDRLSFVTTRELTMLGQLATSSIRIDGVNDFRIAGLQIEQHASNGDLNLAVSGTKAEKTILHGITIAKGTRVIISASKNGIQLECKGEDGVVKGTLSIMPNGQLSTASLDRPVILAGDAIPEQLGFNRALGTSQKWFSVALSLSQATMLIDSQEVSDVQFLQRERNQISPQSSITSGSLSLPLAQKTQALYQGTVLNIDGVGPMQLDYSDTHHFEVRWSGVARSIETRVYDSVRQHAMNQLEALARNQTLVTFWSALVFIWVALKGVRQFV